MAVALPSDIVMDVANAVDATGLRQAHAELMAKARAASGAASAGFQTLSRSDPSATAATAASASTPSIGERFESMFMQVMIQSMLPNMEAVYGSGLAGDMWKSMLAEKLAEATAKQGGLGLADGLLKDLVQQGEQRVALAGVREMDNVLPSERRTDVSRARLSELERVLFGNGTGEDETFSLTRLQSR